MAEIRLRPTMLSDAQMVALYRSVLDSGTGAHFGVRLRKRRGHVVARVVVVADVVRGEYVRRLGLADRSAANATALLQKLMDAGAESERTVAVRK